MVRRLACLSALIILNISTLSAQTEYPDDGVGLIILTEAPVFSGDLPDFIQTNIRYPATALRDSIEGVVVVRFTIDSLGKTTNHRIIKGIREDINNEALRVASLIKFDSPAMQHNKVIRTEFSVPVYFILKQNDKASDQKNQKKKKRD